MAKQIMAVEMEATLTAAMDFTLKLPLGKHEAVYLGRYEDTVYKDSVFTSVGFEIDGVEYEYFTGTAWGIELFNQELLNAAKLPKHLIGNARGRTFTIWVFMKLDAKSGRSFPTLSFKEPVDLATDQVPTATTTRRPNMADIK